MVSANKDVRALVGAAQAEPEVTRDQPLPENVAGERRGGPVVQPVRLPAADFADIERIVVQAKVLSARRLHR